ERTEVRRALLRRAAVAPVDAQRQLAGAHQPAAQGGVVARLDGGREGQFGGLRAGARQVLLRGGQVDDAGELDGHGVGRRTHERGGRAGRCAGRDGVDVRRAAALVEDVQRVAGTAAGYGEQALDAVQRAVRVGGAADVEDVAAAVAGQDRGRGGGSGGLQVDGVGTGRVQLQDLGGRRALDRVDAAGGRAGDAGDGVGRAADVEHRDRGGRQDDLGGGQVGDRGGGDE